MLTRNYGLDLVLHPSAFTRDSSFESWHHFVITRALENRVFFLSLNRAGKDWGHSIFCPPWIDSNERPVVFGEEEEHKTFEISRERIREIRATYPFQADELENYENLKP
jgi:nitrilase